VLAVVIGGILLRREERAGDFANMKMEVAPTTRGSMTVTSQRAVMFKSPIDLLKSDLDKPEPKIAPWFEGYLSKGSTTNPSTELSPGTLPR
jgi:hypothetical protein